jgi:thiosulfate sulfurtransferase
MPYQCISVDETKTLIDNGELTLADIRDSNSYRGGSINDAVNISGDNIDNFVATSNKEQPLVVYCYHGNSSKGAADYFSSQGFSQVYSMDGGYEAWRLQN